MTERLGRRVPVGIHHRGDRGAIVRDRGGRSHGGHGGVRHSGDGHRRGRSRRAYAVRARVADADLDPFVITAPDRRSSAVGPVHVRRSAAVDGRRAR